MGLSKTDLYTTFQTSLQTQFDNVLANTAIKIFCPNFFDTFFYGNLLFGCNLPGSGFDVFISLDNAPSLYAENFITTQSAAGVLQVKNNAAPTLYQEVGATGVGFTLYIQGYIKPSTDTILTVQFACNAAVGQTDLLIGSYLNFNVAAS